MQANRLARAVSLAIAGSAVAGGGIDAANAHTMYNTYNAHASFLATDAGGNGTDGWTWGGVGNPTLGALTASPGWVGTANATTTPFGYAGQAHLNWATEMHHHGTATVSQQDAFDDWGIWADIDTAGGAWKDASASQHGWKHNTDIGLFMIEEDAFVTLNASTLTNVFGNFGITVFEGMDTTPVTTPPLAYSHHGNWNSATKPSNTSNPWYAAGVGSGMTYLIHDATVDNDDGLTFWARANVIYTIALGGSGGVHWNQQHDGYALTITAAPVPVPAAVWLFGSALAGLGTISRRRRRTV